MLSPSQISLANQVAQALLNNGAPADKLGWLIGQLSIESSNFTSPLATNFNNFGGIKFYNQNTPGVSDGEVSPEGDDYAYYDSIDDFAQDYLRVLNTVGTARPLQQTTPQAFVQALKTNGYFGGDLQNYINIVTTNSAYYLNNVLTNLTADVKAAATAATTAATTVATTAKNNPGKTILVVGGILFSLWLLSKHNSNG